MKVFVAGATGAIGRHLLPRLREAGHDVVGLTRSAAGADAIRAAGAQPAVADALDPDALKAAVSDAQPDAIVHQLTSITNLKSVRDFDGVFAVTNRLRTEGTDHLLAAARAAGTRRFLAQSYAGWTYAREGGPVKTEEDRLDPTPAKPFRETLAAIRYLEDAVTGAEDLEGVALRYGGFYGPGTSLTRGGAQVEAVRKRRFPIVGEGRGVWSFIHTEDAASATVTALERGAPGIYNIVDDDPAPAAEWLSALADALGAKPPRRVPRWLGRLAGGAAVVVLMDEIRGASNEKAKRELDWQPRWASWREGFRNGLE